MKTMIKVFFCLMIIGLSLEAGPFKRGGEARAFKLTKSGEVNTGKEKSILDDKGNFKITIPSKFDGSIIFKAFGDYPNKVGVSQPTKGGFGSKGKEKALDKFQTFLQKKNTQTATKKLIGYHNKDGKKIPIYKVSNRLDHFKSFKNTLKNNSTTKSSVDQKKPTVSPPVFVKKPKPVRIQAITLKPVNPVQATQKSIQAEQSKGTIIKNSTLSTTTKIGKVDVKGKLNVSNINVASGAEIKDSNIITNVKAKDISVGKGANSDIGSVNIEE